MCTLKAACRTSVLTILTVLLTAFPALARVEIAGGTLVFSPADRGVRYELSITGPGDFQHTERFARGEQITWTVPDGQAGRYKYELVSIAAPRVRGKSPATSASRTVISGSALFNGLEFANPALPENFDKAEVFSTDLITKGSNCTGTDCTSSESFGSDTIRLKENNLRIHFDDTSSSSSFPQNDWRLQANDSGNGGDEYFALVDATANKKVFRVDAGAPSNSLYVSSDGNVGVGTSSPGDFEIRVVDGDNPTLRLEQDGSNGFNSQIWDIAGNEANFFVRDVTNSSNLPLRIKPGSGNDNALVIDGDGNVGFGKGNPTQDLHIKRSDADSTFILIENTNSAAQNVGFQLVNDTSTWNFFNNTEGDFVISESPNAIEAIKIDEATGDVIIANDLTVTGQCTEVDGACAPDYVFAPDYELRSLTELSAFISENRHLPGVPSAAEIHEHGVNMRGMSFALLEKVEEVVLYTLDQQSTINQQERTIGDLQATLTEMADRLAALESQE